MKRNVERERPMLAPSCEYQLAQWRQLFFEAEFDADYIDAANIYSIRSVFTNFEEWRREMVQQIIFQYAFLVNIIRHKLAILMAMLELEAQRLSIVRSDLSAERAERLTIVRSTLEKMSPLWHSLRGCQDLKFEADAVGLTDKARLYSFYLEQILRVLSHVPYDPTFLGDHIGELHQTIVVLKRCLAVLVVVTLEEQKDHPGWSGEIEPDELETNSDVLSHDIDTGHSEQKVVANSPVATPASARSISQVVAAVEPAKRQNFAMTALSSFLVLGPLTYWHIHKKSPLLPSARIVTQEVVYTLPLNYTPNTNQNWPNYSSSFTLSDAWLRQQCNLLPVDRESPACHVSLQTTIRTIFTAQWTNLATCPAFRDYANASLATRARVIARFSGILTRAIEAEDRRPGHAPVFRGGSRPSTRALTMMWNPETCADFVVAVHAATTPVQLSLTPSGAVVATGTVFGAQRFSFSNLSDQIRARVR